VKKRLKIVPRPYFFARLQPEAQETFHAVFSCGPSAPVAAGAKQYSRETAWVLSIVPWVRTLGW